jgi:hypothetical protein
MKNNVSSDIMNDWLSGKGYYISHAITNGFPHEGIKKIVNFLCGKGKLVFFPFENPLPEKYIVPIDLCLCGTAGTLVLDLSKPSIGATVEAFRAKQSGVFIVGIKSETPVSPFASFLCDYIVTEKDFRDERVFKNVLCKD